MIGQALQKADARCCGYPLDASLRPCLADKEIGPLVQCKGCEKMQEVRLWCGICGKNAPTEAYVGYDAKAAVERFNAETERQVARRIREKNELGARYEAARNAKLMTRRKGFHEDHSRS